MNLIHVRTARSIWLFDMVDLNPRGKNITEKLVEWVRDKYHFSVAPDSKNLPVVINNKEGLVFEHGTFQVGEVSEEISIEVKFTIFNDGIVIDTRSSTADGNRFAEDLLKNAVQEFGLSFDENTVRKRLYFSELIVRSELSLAGLNPISKDFSTHIEAVIPENQRRQFRCAGLSFWSEPGDDGQHKRFVIEREVGRAFAENRYFCQAPTSTKAHLKLLETFEQMLQKGA